MNPLKKPLAWALFGALCGLCACLTLQGCERDPVGAGQDSVILVIPTPKISFFPHEGHDYLYLSRRTHPIYGPPTVEACSVWVSHARAPYATTDVQDTVFRVQERRACYTTGSTIEHGYFSSDSQSTRYIVKNATTVRDYDTSNGLAGLQAAPPFDVNFVDVGETRKISFYGDSLAIAGGTRNDLFLQARGRVLYSRTYPSVYQNWYGSFEELRLLRYDSLEVTDSMINGYVGP